VSRRFLTPVNAPAFASDPATPTPVQGDTYFNTVSNVLRVYTGSAWIDVAGGGSSVAYQDDAPASPEIGSLWVESDATAGGLNQNDYITKAEALTYALNPTFHPFLLGGM
jgi:hypothetical protein